MRGSVKLRLMHPGKNTVMVSGVQSSSKSSRGFFAQMHNASTSDLLWGGKSFKKGKRNVSLHYFAVERLISKRSSGGTVSSSFGFDIVVCQLLLHFCCSLTHILTHKMYYF